MENENYTIKDIARMAGVSAGTVDRVLHNRGDVSEASRKKVQAVLDDIHYQPNVFAIGLAAKKRYRIVCMIPYYNEHDYWSSVAQGIKRAADELRPFNVSVEFEHYHHADKASYDEACSRIEVARTDGVLLAPNFRNDTLELTARLEKAKVAYAFIDFNVEQTRPLCYIGQDSRASGYLAAMQLMQRYAPGDELVIFLNNQKNSPAEIQMQRRLEGFMRYIAEVYDHLNIYDVVLQKGDDGANRQILDDFFAAHPGVQLGAVFNSRIYQVSSYLQATGRRMKGLMGYDLLPQNVEYLRSGEVSFLIGQRPCLQGYCGVKALADSIVFKRSVAPMRYMPIDLLIRENIDFYFEF